MKKKKTMKKKIDNRNDKTVKIEPKKREEKEMRKKM
jgi:hypothetical protein